MINRFKIIYFLSVLLLVSCVYSIKTTMDINRIKYSNVQLLSRNEHRYIGYIIDKTISNDKYFVVVIGYGYIEVSKVEYYESQQGKKCPDFILERYSSGDPN